MKFNYKLNLLNFNCSLVNGHRSELESKSNTSSLEQTTSTSNRSWMAPIPPPRYTAPLPCTTPPPSGCAMTNQRDAQRSV
uniref:Uncharacterized protein n=1 Tax=Arundo donax TaxID=35708 RepID=A0A0A9TZ76_ARUDO